VALVDVEPNMVEFKPTKNGDLMEHHRKTHRKMVVLPSGKLTVGS